ncbi:membrane protein [Gandjariella thermophila]|uniref:Membrane protein n=1 Tax=Gandjariella thermophila TaxID=1931992 RepID=A0A4D4J1A2_9PSEU|nr:polyprenol phosphomannose-dependent alpha 1,6 mannosyltransferase MptB [Gandjariella thermophila]GDY28930.1 membrane protein [Gandjariella thermophila]
MAVGPVERRKDDGTRVDLAGDVTGGGAPAAARDEPPSTGSATAEPAPLNAAEDRLLDLLRRIGTVGALLMAAGSLGAGAAPVYNPLPSVPVLGLFARIPTAAMACAFTGMFLVILAWLYLGRLVRPGRPRLVSRSQMDRTLVMWTVPLFAVPPMFSRDVYSYLAQSDIAAKGLDPYLLGPAQALGVDHPLTRGVPNIWRDTPAPYGPLFLSIGRALTQVTGDHVVSGVLLQRVVELVGLAMVVWALPRLARRFGVQPVSALWLGAANPLVLFHVVVGAHNDTLAIGLMLTGLELALRRLPAVLPGEPVPPRQPGEITGVVLGAVGISAGAMVKIPAVLALGFLVVIVARRWGGRAADLGRAILLVGAVSLAMIVLICVGSRLGFGWLTTLGTPGKIRSWLSPATGVGFLGATLALLFDLGNHTDRLITLSRVVGTAAGGLISLRLLWQTFRGRMVPMIGLGAGLGAMLVLGPVVQPWYLLWAVIVLATAAGTSRFRTWAAGVSAVVAVLVPPTGTAFDGRAYVLPQAYLAAALVVLTVLFALRGRLPSVGTVLRELRVSAPRT